MLKNEKKLRFHRQTIVSVIDKIDIFCIYQTIIFHETLEVGLVPKHGGLARTDIGKQTVAIVQHVAMPVDELLLAPLYILNLALLVLALLLKLSQPQLIVLDEHLVAGNRPLLRNVL